MAYWFHSSSCGVEKENETEAVKEIKDIKTAKPTNAEVITQPGTFLAIDPVTAEELDSIPKYENDCKNTHCIIFIVFIWHFMGYKIYTSNVKLCAITKLIRHF